MTPATAKITGTRSLQQADWLDGRLLQAVGWGLVCAHMSVQILASFSATPNKYDDANPLVASDLILHGRTPGVDFVNGYPPLYYYLIAAGFRFLGRTLLVPRLFAAALYVVVVIVAARFLLRA